MSFFEKISCGALICKNDPYSTIIEANNAFYNLIGYTKEEMSEVFDNKFSALVIDDLNEILKKVSNAVKTKNVLDYEFRIRNKKGDILWIHDIATYNPEDDLFYVVIMDVTYREKILKNISKFSEIDSLSQLLNRGALEKKIKKKISNKKIESQAMFLIDLDNFKQLNDTKGHQVGDEIIKIVGEKLKLIFGKEFILGRLGGDEFLVYLENPSSENILHHYAEKILNNLKFNSDNVVVEASIGAIYDTTKKFSFEELYNLSDINLYETKNTQKGKYILKTF
ncbi:sensor domain-containing diguanylate cyclase [uncultured Cetobacterium sp.]|uniref:sensor domain-containing diguanylate cyclase n=2 Tax=Cetobacterium TaxID=180162 RepID=UPI0025D736B9|nr:sensor domain-containing diguanylate cyclase [uncultured Cetobacterium sp.]